MLREPKGARRFNDVVMLTKRTSTVDEFGQANVGEPEDVLEVYAKVIQMSATKTMLTFQQADVVGLDIELRNPGVTFNGLRWRGHDVHFPTPEDVDNRGRYLRISGWYQIDNPNG